MKKYVHGLLHAASPAISAPTNRVRSFRASFPYLSLLLLVTFLIVQSNGWAQVAPTFTQTVVFGDSLSDDGNVRHIMEDNYFISYPGGDFDYSDGRFTDSSDTDPSSTLYAGTWHE